MPHSWAGSPRQAPGRGSIFGVIFRLLTYRLPAGWRCPLTTHRCRVSVATPVGATAYAFDARNRIETATADGPTTTYSYYADSEEKLMGAFRHWGRQAHGLETRVDPGGPQVQ